MNSDMAITTVVLPAFYRLPVLVLVILWHSPRRYAGFPRPFFSLFARNPADHDRLCCDLRLIRILVVDSQIQSFRTVAS